MRALSYEAVMEISGGVSVCAGVTKLVAGTVTAGVLDGLSGGAMTLATPGEFAFGADVIGGFAADLIC